MAVRLGPRAAVMARAVHDCPIVRGSTWTAVALGAMALLAAMALRAGSRRSESARAVAAPDGAAAAGTEPPKVSRASQAARRARVDQRNPELANPVSSLQPILGSPAELEAYLGQRVATVRQRGAAELLDLELGLRAIESVRHLLGEERTHARAERFKAELLQAGR